MTDLLGGTPEFNAKAIMALLDGTPSAYRDIVVFNAAAALLIAGKAADLKDGAKQAGDSIDSGRAKQTLTTLVAITNDYPKEGKAG